MAIFKSEKKAVEQRTEIRFLLRMTPEEHEAIKKISDKYGLSLNKAFKQLIAHAAFEELVVKL